MKRSEMEKLIFNKLKHQYLNSMRSWDEVIEMVLDEAEEAGMLPPERISGHEDDCPYYDGDECECGGYKEHSWEPEND